MGIFESGPARASRIVMLMAGAAACGGRTSPADTPPGPTPARTVDLASVYLLQMSGTRPPDTTVTLTSGTPRHILFRTAQPDNTVLADVYGEFDVEKFAAAPSCTTLYGSAQQLLASLCLWQATRSSKLWWYTA